VLAPEWLDVRGLYEIVGARRADPAARYVEIVERAMCDAKPVTVTNLDPAPRG